MGTSRERIPCFSVTCWSSCDRKHAISSRDVPVFHSKRLILHGGTRVKCRQEMVGEFNGDRFIDVTLENKVVSMLRNADVDTERILHETDLTGLFGVL